MNLQNNFMFGFEVFFFEREPGAAPDKLQIHG